MTCDATFDIEQLIPHRLPMRLVEAVVSVDEIAITATAEVRDTWPTVRDGHAQSLMLIELVAQTAAALQGWRERHADDSKAGMGGLLVGIPDATPLAPTIPVGTPLVCMVRITHGTLNYLAFSGQVTSADGQPWLTGSIQAYRPDNLEMLGEAP